LSLVMLLSSVAFAQSAKKRATTQKATTAKQGTAVEKPALKAATGIAPKLETKDPSFIGFTGSFVKFGRVTGEERPFTFAVEYSPWFFEVKGTANAGYNTPDLDDDAIVVLAYYNAQGKAADGTNYQAGLFDLMIYFDGEPIKISNLSFTLTGKAAAGAAVLAQAKTWNLEQGRVFRTKRYDDPIFRSRATALDKIDIERELAAAKKRTADSIAREEKRVSDSIARVEKRRRDSIARERQRVIDSIAEYEALREQARRKAAAQKKRRAVEEYDYDDDEEDYEPPPKKRSSKKAASAKKRRVVEEYDDDEEDYEPPPPRRKTAKNRR